MSLKVVKHIIPKLLMFYNFFNDMLLSKRGDQVEETINDAYLKCLYEVGKLQLLEWLVKDGEMLTKEMSEVGSNVIILLRQNLDIELGNYFIGKCEEMCQLEDTKVFANRMVHQASQDLPWAELSKKDEILKETPDEILRIMDLLMIDSRHVDDLMGEKFDLRYFSTLLLINRVGEFGIVNSLKMLTKEELFNEYELDDDENGIRHTIRRVANEYSELLQADRFEADLSYDTVKKRMQKILPSQRNLMTMDQSHYLNIFEQYSLMNHMLIYHTKYQRYLSNSNTQDPPSYKHFKDLKEPIRLLLKYEPLNGIEDELYLETIMEDTFHFALFNALTKLFMKVLEDTVAFMEKTNNLPTLAVLFVIEQIENQLPLISKKWESYFGVNGNFILH